MTLIRKAAIAAIALLLMPLTASADGNFVLFKYGNFDTWVTRQIHESAVIGGNKKTLYAPHAPLLATIRTPISAVRRGEPATSWLR